jgi:hypothetical protein
MEAAVDLVSPALSASVFRLGSGSLSTIQSVFDFIVAEFHAQDTPSLCFSEAGGNIFDTGFERALLCDSEISARPFPGEGIRLGGRNPDVRIYCSGKESVN